MTTFIRRVLQHYLNDTCTIERAHTEPDEYGHPAETWGVVATAACRILPLERVQSYRGVMAEQEKGRTYYGLVLPWNADINDGDRVICGEITYQVVQVDTDRTDAADQRAVIVRVGS